MAIEFRTSSVAIPNGTGRRSIAGNTTFGSPVVKASVAMNGFKLDYTKSDHDINVLEADTEISQARTLRKSRGQLKQVSSDTAEETYAPEFPDGCASGTSCAARWLTNLSAEAGASIEEVGEELLTLHGLGLTGELRKSLASTNLIESLFSVVREKIHRVKNWKGRRSNQILRWVASAIRAHRTKMRRVRGMTQAAILIAALGPRPLAAHAA